MKVAESINESYAQSKILKKDPWENPEFQGLVLEATNRWPRDVAIERLNWIFNEERYNEN